MHPESFPGGTHGHRARPERLSGSTLDRATRDARLADAAWHGGVGTAIMSPDGRYLEVNPALCAFLERSADDLLQLRWQDLTPADTLTSTQAAVDDLVRGDVAMLRTRKSWRTPDGRTVWGDLTSVAVRDADGAAAFLVSQVVDVTVEVAALAALSTSEERFRRIAENASGVTFEADVHGRLTWISPSVRTLTGWHDDELVGTAGAGYIHPDDLAEFRAAQIALTCGDDARLIDFRFRCADGSYRWFSSEVRPLRNADGAVVGQVGTWRDTDAAHRAEAAQATAEAGRRLHASTSLPSCASIRSIS